MHPNQKPMFLKVLSTERRVGGQRLGQAVGEVDRIRNASFSSQRFALIDSVEKKYLYKSSHSQWLSGSC